MYEPLKIFFYIGTFIGGIGSLLLLRFLYFFFFTQSGHGHVQSLIFGVAFLIVGVQIFLIGLVSDLIASNRKLIEKVLLRLKTEKLNEDQEINILHIKKDKNK